MSGDPLAALDAPEKKEGNPCDAASDDPLMIIRYQRGVLACLGIHLAIFTVGIPLLVACDFILDHQPSLSCFILAAATIFAIKTALFVTWAVSIIVAGLLVASIFGAWLGVIAAILMIVPGLNILLMLLASWYATHWLRRHGVAAGWLGVKAETRT